MDRPRMTIGGPLLVRSVGVLAAALVVLASLGVFSPHAAPRGTVVGSLTTSAYGSVLVVGGDALSGLAGFPLYEFSGDVDGHLGCATTLAQGDDLNVKVSVPLTCTGPQSDMIEGVSTDDWPALTTDGAPVAGPGVDARLLGTIYRRHIGEQVTYADHPLYLFDPPSTPFLPQGEDFMETVSPLAPWHGYWFLVRASNGAPAPGVATLEVETLPDGRHALSAREDPNVDPVKVSVYYFNGVASAITGCGYECDAAWVPLLTSRRPEVEGLSPREVATLQRPDGTLQVTFRGRPLYLYARERLPLGTGRKLNAPGSAGNGNGLEGPYPLADRFELIYLGA